MPAVGGPDLAQRLLRERPEMKVLFMSGSTEHGINDIAAVPHAKFILKPFSAKALGRKIREVLETVPALALQH
jgi:FixJ family two-component response regulator